MFTWLLHHHLSLISLLSNSRSQPTLLRFHAVSPAFHATPEIRTRHMLYNPGGFSNLRERRLRIAKKRQPRLVNEENHESSNNDRLNHRDLHRQCRSKMIPGIE